MSPITKYCSPEYIKKELSFSESKKKFYCGVKEEEAPPTWLVVYKILSCVLLTSLTIGHIYSTLHRLGLKWLIFLTNQGMICIIIYNFIHTIIIVRYNLKLKIFNYIQILQKIFWLEARSTRKARIQDMLDLQVLLDFQESCPDHLPLCDPSLLDSSASICCGAHASTQHRRLDLQHFSPCLQLNVCPSRSMVLLDPSETSSLLPSTCLWYQLLYIHILLLVPWRWRHLCLILSWRRQDDTTSACHDEYLK